MSRQITLTIGLDSFERLALTAFEAGGYLIVLLLAWTELFSNGGRRAIWSLGTVAIWVCQVEYGYQVLRLAA